MNRVQRIQTSVTEETTWNPSRSRASWHAHGQAPQRALSGVPRAPDVRRGLQCHRASRESKTKRKPSRLGKRLPILTRQERWGFMSTWNDTGLRNTRRDVTKDAPSCLQGKVLHSQNQKELHSGDSILDGPWRAGRFPNLERKKKSGEGEEGASKMSSHTGRKFNSAGQSCPTLCNPMDCSTPGLPVYHQLLELTQTHVHRVSDAIQPSHPLSSPSPPGLNLSQHQGLFQWVSSPHQVARVLEFQLQHQSIRWYSGLISFRRDWLDLLAVQGTLESLLQPHSSKVSILHRKESSISWAVPYRHGFWEKPIDVLTKQSTVK